MTSKYRLIWIDPKYYDMTSSLNEIYQRYFLVGTQEIIVRVPSKDFSKLPSKDCNLHLDEIAIQCMPMQMVNLLLIGLYDVKKEKLIAMGEPKVFQSETDLTRRKSL